ncbi:hypothetical protein PILCRDRAFT_99093 [Piloderma croceum F 1598]|uniref:Uncharacterized protein n=1 Tax=Piloderma croceum (strain F 1598) TaxID=765440 RepID=A0A0C3F442_PILCF|nr:hypothetical protein PILCRDRAFT_99093 [Piloderma croceum F 1598]
MYYSKNGHNNCFEAATQPHLLKQVYQPDGTALKQKVKMCDGSFADGSSQSLYYRDGHDLTRVFKGMGQILQEWGYVGALKIRAECLKFHCEKGAVQCCCQQMLYNEPDFVTGFCAILFPKFHYKLNFIEKWWGYSKWIYCQCPVSSKEADLECNVLTSLKLIPLKCICQFSTRGLNGKQAVWASKQYHGHCVLPESIMRDLTTAGIN